MLLRLELADLGTEHLPVRMMMRRRGRRRRRRKRRRGSRMRRRYATILDLNEIVLL